MKDRIIEMASNGIPATNIAAALGCTDGYISQVLSEEGVIEKVQAARADRFQKFAARDNSLEAAEEKALVRMTSLIPFITKPAEAARVYGVLNAAKRKTADASNSSGPVNTIVQINIPQSARVAFTLTADKQVIEVEGRSMVTMQAKTLANQLESRHAARLLNTPIPTTLNLTGTSVRNKL